MPLPSLCAGIDAQRSAAIFTGSPRALPIGGMRNEQSTIGGATNNAVHKNIETRSIQNYQNGALWNVNESVFVLKGAE